MTLASRIVLFGFDGLRPDLVSAESMPHLHRFMREGSVFANARSVFPSETRVAIPSLATGCLPGTHGLVANSLYDAGAAPDRVLNTKYARDIDALTATYGRLLAVPSLGARLCTFGRRLDVVWTGTLGASRSMFPEAEELGALRWHLEEATTAAQGLEARFGPVPPASVPALARVRHGARIFVEHVLAERRPDVAAFWSSEPDVSYHYRGVGSAEAKDAMREADNAFADVLAWRERQDDRDAIVVIAMSDHGHVTGQAHVDVAAKLRAGGFAAGRDFGHGASIAIGGGGAPGLWMRGPTRAEVQSLASWLADQPWVSLVLARNEDVPNAIPLATLGALHDRSPDIAFTFISSDERDEHGIRGCALIEAADIPVGGGMHGGLHRRELANVLAMGGGPVLKGAVLKMPADITDVAPTVLRLLGLPPERMDGVALECAWGNAPDAPPIRTTVTGGRAQLSVFRMGTKFRPDGVIFQ